MAKENAFTTKKPTAAPVAIPYQAWSDTRPRTSDLKTAALAAVQAKVVVFKK